MCSVRNLLRRLGRVEPGRFRGLPPGSRADRQLNNLAFAEANSSSLSSPACFI
jgi:hypothetical protein